MTMETEDIASVPDMVFSCPICGRYYSWGCKEDRSAFEELPKDESKCLPDKCKIKNEIDRMIDNAIVDNDFWDGYTSALEIVLKFIDTL